MGLPPPHTTPLARSPRLLLALLLLLERSVRGASASFEDAEGRGNEGNGGFTPLAPPAASRGWVAATAVEWLLAGRNRVRGMVGLAEMVEPLAFLDDLAVTGLEAQLFEGDRALV